MPREPRPGLPAAVLWDMDGTIIDTEPYWMAEEHLLVERHGGRWTDEHAHALVGNDLMVSARYIIEHSPVDMTPEEVVDALLVGVVERVREQTPWRPGALELLDDLHRFSVPCALVTMSWRPLADAVLDSLPHNGFTVVVTGDVVEHGKPHAEPYLHAARLLGVDPARCVAIEDSRTGVASAEAAGVPILAVPHVQEVPPAPGRSRVPTLEGLTPHDLGAIASGRVLDTV